MISHVLQIRFRRTLTHATSSRLYPGLVGLMAFAATISMTVPFAPLLTFAVLLRRDRWLPIVLLSALGSAVGGLVLYLVFHHLGWNNLMAAYPDTAHSQSLTNAKQWLTTYGISTLLVVSALPVPDTPVLIFAGISRLPVVEVLLALLVGKLAKYSIYSWIVATFPDRFAHYFAHVTNGSKPTAPPAQGAFRESATHTEK